ncbi:hypothetical protein N7524_006007 [Penicillium chrysogenum]|nr:hypothetical protein N7524_006007 [Penicillium chrysogenum]
MARRRARTKAWYKDAVDNSGLKHQQENVLPNGVTTVGSERDDNALRWGSDTNSVMPADFNSDGDIYPDRWPTGEPGIVWAHFIPVFADYYALVGSHLRKYMWLPTKKMSHAKIQHQVRWSSRLRNYARHLSSKQGSTATSAGTPAMVLSKTTCLDGQRQPADRLLPTAWGLPSSSATGVTGTACYKGYEPCTSAPWSPIQNISIDSQKSNLEMYASNESSAKRSFPSDSLPPIKVEVHWVHNVKVAGYQEAAQAIEGAENRGKETNPDRALHDDMIRPQDGSTILFFTEADVFAMSKDNITTQSKLSRVLIDGGSTVVNSRPPSRRAGFTEGSQIRNSFNAFAVYESHIGTTQNPERHRDLGAFQLVRDAQLQVLDIDAQTSSQSPGPQFRQSPTHRVLVLGLAALYPLRAQRLALIPGQQACPQSTHQRQMLNGSYHAERRTNKSGGRYHSGYCTSGSG